MADPELAAVVETSAITTALECARSKVETDDWIGDDPEKRKIWEQTCREFSGIFDEDDAQTSSELEYPKLSPPRPVVLDYPKLSPPRPVPDPEIDAVVRHRYQRLLDTQDELMRSTRLVLQADPRLRPHMEEVLVDLGRQDLWARLA